MKGKLLKKGTLKDLFKLISRDYEVIAPVKNDGGFAFSIVESAGDIDLAFPLTTLPAKKYLLPPVETMFVTKDGDIKEALPETRYAFLGLHVCDINGIARLGLVLSNDAYYRARRDNALIIGVSCKPDKNCFCKSMKANELAPGTWDLFLEDRSDHFAVFSGSETGRKLLNSEIFEPSSVETGKICMEYEETTRISYESVWKNMAKKYGDAVWTETGGKCLGCTNCTTVCPLCYCYDVHDATDVTPETGRRLRLWDSCTLSDFTTVAGGHNFRKDIVARYRNIYSHKFSAYMDEFGVPACVGCGRCITFCPASIDMRETLKRIGGA